MGQYRTIRRSLCIPASMLPFFFQEARQSITHKHGQEPAGRRLTKTLDIFRLTFLSFPTVLHIAVNIFRGSRKYAKRLLHREKLTISLALLRHGLEERQQDTVQTFLGQTLPFKSCQDESLSLSKVLLPLLPSFHVFRLSSELCRLPHVTL